VEFRLFWPILEDQANTFAPGDPGRSFQFSRDTVEHGVRVGHAEEGEDAHLVRSKVLCPGYGPLQDRGLLL
jgi:hypothetical protein